MEKSFKEYLNETADQSEMYVLLPYNRKHWFVNLARAWHLNRNITLKDLENWIFWKKVSSDDKERVKKYFY